MAGAHIGNPKPQFFDASGNPLVGGTLTVYLAGTTTLTNTWQDRAQTTLNTNPITLDARGECSLWLDALLTYKFVLKNALGVEQWTYDNITGGSGASSTISFLQAGTGAVTRTAQAKMREVFSIADFTGVDPTGTTDSTAGIQAALDYAKSFSALANELTVIWPAGDYKVTSLNFVGCSRVTMQALGGVNIYGTSVGGTSIINLDGGTTTQTNKLNFLGNFSVQIAGGASYQYGIKISYLNNSNWSFIVASGAYSVNSIYIDYAWDNPRLEMYGTNSSGLAIATIKCGSNNVNRNHFNCRTTGSSNMAVASIGFELNGVANVLEGDFSSSQIGIKLTNARGSTIISPYHEINKVCVDASAGNSSGNVILGGFYEVGTNGAAFDLSSTQNTTIVSPYIKGIGGGSGRVAFAMGTACYALNVIAPNIDTTTIDTVSSGTWRGTGGFTNDFKVLGAQWLAFPATQVSSSNANTIDDYKEGTSTAWTPVITAQTPGNLAVTYSTQRGSYTKIGRLNVLSCSIATSAFTHTTAGGEFRITGVPFASDTSTGRIVGVVSFGGLTKAGYTQFDAYIEDGTSIIVLKASGTGVARANVGIADFPTGGTVIIDIELTYFTAT